MSIARAAADHLADILEQENSALRRLDLPSAAALLGAKRAALSGLEQATRADADATRDPAMRETAHHLRDVSMENKRLLERAMIVQQHVMSLLAQAASISAPSRGYGAAGVHVASQGGKAFALSARA